MTGLPIRRPRAGRRWTARPSARLPVSGIKLQTLHPFVHVLLDVTDGCLKEVVCETTQCACAGQFFTDVRNLRVLGLRQARPSWRSSVPALVRRTATARVRSPSSESDLHDHVIQRLFAAGLNL